MTEGTKSYLIGCHQFLLHPIFVLIAWKLEYKSWPKWWELIGILLHDIGYCGRQYLSDSSSKNGHWLSGAEISGKMVRKLSKGNMNKRILFWRSFVFCAGHAPKESGFSKSKLFTADKRSWLIAPTIWMWTNYYVEFNNKRGWGLWSPKEFKKMMRENLKKETPLGAYDLGIAKRKGE